MAVNISNPLPCGARSAMPIPHLQPLDSLAPSIAAASHPIHRQISCRSTSSNSNFTSSSSSDGASRFHPFHHAQPYHWHRTSPMHVAFDSTSKNPGYSSGDEPTRSLAPLSNSNPFQPLSKDAAMGLVLQAASGKGWTTGSGLEGPAFSDISAQNPNPEQQSSWSKSPRRRMRVAFTCNVCGVRTMRAINPHAYTDGTVFVQCKGCNVFHKLVDNLNLFFEWDGRMYKTMRSIPPGGKLYKLMHTDDDIPNEDGESSSWPV